MAVDFIELDSVLSRAVPSLIKYKEGAKHQAEEALTVFLNLPISQEALINRSNELFPSMARMMRWGHPTYEPITAQFSPPCLPSDMTLVAVDASNFMSDYRSLVDFGFINTAVITWPIRAGVYQNVEFKTMPSIYFENQLISQQGNQLTDGHLLLVRDVMERDVLTRVALDNQKNGAVFCLRDGPIEAWGDFSTSQSGSYQVSLKQITESYKTNCAHRIPVGGFVSGAKTNLILRMIDVALTADSSIAVFRQNRNQRFFPGVNDGSLLKRWLAPGNRTAVFKIASQAQSVYYSDPDLAVHLFFINTAKEGDPPAICRVEIAGWMCIQEWSHLIGKLHSIVLDQCHMISAAKKPYPYILARCDELSHMDRGQVDSIQRRVLNWYLESGGKEFDQSPKDYFKSLGRSR